MKSDKPRRWSVDFLRLLACGIVIGSHTNIITNSTFVPGRVAVITFFTISGWVLNFSSGPLHVLAPRRLVRLYLPVIVIIMATAIRYIPIDEGLWTFLRKSTTLLTTCGAPWEPNRPLWTISYELFAVIVVYILKAMRTQWGSLRTLLCLWLFFQLYDGNYVGILFGGMAGVVEKHTAGEWISTCKLACATCSGVFLFVVFSTISIDGKHACQWIGFSDSPICIPKQWIIECTVTSLVLLVTRVESLAPSWVSYGIVQAARPTYGLYMLHAALLGVFDIGHDRPPLVYWPVLISLSIVFTFLVDEPSMRLSKYLFRVPEQASASRNDSTHEQVSPEEAPALINVEIDEDGEESCLEHVMLLLPKGGGGTGNSTDNSSL